MTPLKRKRIALIGLGTHGFNAVLPAIGHTAEWELAAVADNNPGHLQRLPHLRGYTSVETLLQEEELDAVYIATLPDSHCAIALAALRRGLHVICEKPMAANAEETALMLETARAHGRELVVMFENRFQPYYRQVRRWIGEGALGRVEAIHLQSFGKHPLTQPRRTHLLNAAGSLDCGIHMLDIVRYWNAGTRWQTIHALGTWFDEPVERPPHVSILARLDNGVMVTFDSSFSYGYRIESEPRTFGRRTLVIVGTHGVIIDAGEGDARELRLISDSRRESVPVKVSEHEHEIHQVLDAFARWLRSDADAETAASLARGEDGHEAQRIVDAVNTQAVRTRPVFREPIATRRQKRLMNDSPSIFNVLIVGCGHMGTSHAKAYAERTDCRIVGIVSRSTASRAKLQQTLGSAYPEFSDYHTALSETRPHIVCIATYPDTHAAYAIAALEAGAHVFVEKPIAETVEEAQRVLATARRTGRKLVVGYILRQHPSWVRFVELARTLGKPLVMRMNLNQQSSGTEWRTHQSLMESLPPIVDCGVHYVDVMCQMTGAAPVRVHAIGARLDAGLKPQMYNYGQLQVQFADGSVGWYEAGWGPMMSREAFFVKDVCGPRGSVSIVSGLSAEDSANVEGHTQTGALRLHHADLTPEGEFARKDEIFSMSGEPDHDALCAREQAFLLDAIRTDADLDAHLEAAVSSLAVVLAADRSIREERSITLPPPV